MNKLSSWFYSNEVDNMNIAKRCNRAGCKEFISTSVTYCDDHRQHANQAYDKARYSSEYGKKYKDFYNSGAWKNLRYQTMLASGFICSVCSREATIGDHIIPVKERWDLRLDANNIQSMCVSCHNKKSAEDIKIYNK